MRDGIPVFFSSCGKENGHSWSKEKTLRDELTGKAVNSPQTGTGRHELPKKSGSRLPAALYPNIKSAYPRICECGAQRGGKPNRRISTPVRSASLRTLSSFPVLSSSLALRPLGGWFFLPRPSSPGGGSKGESTKAPPGADKAARFRGNGTIGGPSGLGIVLP